MGIFSKFKEAIANKLKQVKDIAEIAVPDAQNEPVSTGNHPVSTDSHSNRKLTTAELAAKLDRMENDHPEDLAWRKSIVDLMKLVDMDSSYSALKEMALDLGYSQSDIDSKGSAEMNMWLHKKVLVKLSEDTQDNLALV